MLRMDSRTKKEILDARIAELQKKNAEREKRILEVEADKQNAARQNALVQLTTPKENWCAERVEFYDDEPRQSNLRARDRFSEQTVYYDDEPKPSRRPELHAEQKPQNYSKSNTNSTRGGVERTVYCEDEPKPLRRPEASNRCVLQNAGRTNTSWGTERSVFYEGEPKPLRHPEANRCVLQNAGRTNTNRGSERGKLTSSVSSSGAVSYTFAEGDGPPPDPAYSFLADVERDPVRIDRGKRSPRGRDAGRGVGVPARNRPNDTRATRGVNDGKGDARTRSEYKAWKAERERIDQERINRQKTPDGQWRREWDRGKVPLESGEDRAMPRSDKSGPRRDLPASNYRDPEARTLKDFVCTVETPGSGDTSVSNRMQHENQHGAFKGIRGILRGKRRIPSSPVVVVPPQNMAAFTLKQESLDQLSGDRNVKSVGKTIQVCVPNDSTTSPAPVQRVKVNARSVIGTGRVGPRQKVRLSYSSQSEDEANHQKSQQPNERKFSQPKVLPKQQQLEMSSQNPAADKLQAVQLTAKPPRPPSAGQIDDPKPRRSRETRLWKRSGRRDSNENANVDFKVGDEITKELSAEEAQGGNESDDDGDDSWEDATTTSGNESMCEFSAEDTTPTKNKLSIQVNFNRAEDKDGHTKLEERVVRELDDTNLEGTESISALVGTQLGEVEPNNTQTDHAIPTSEAIDHSAQELEKAYEKGSNEPPEKYSVYAKEVGLLDAAYETSPAKEKGNNEHLENSNPVEPLSLVNVASDIHVQEHSSSEIKKIDTDVLMAEVTSCTSEEKDAKNYCLEEDSKFVQMIRHGVGSGTGEKQSLLSGLEETLIDNTLSLKEELDTTLNDNILLLKEEQLENALNDNTLFLKGKEEEVEEEEEELKQIQNDSTLSLNEELETTLSLKEELETAPSLKEENSTEEDANIENRKESKNVILETSSNTAKAEDSNISMEQHCKSEINETEDRKQFIS